MDIMKPKNIKYWYGNTERYRLLFKNNKINTEMRKGTDLPYSRLPMNKYRSSDGNKKSRLA